MYHSPDRKKKKLGIQGFNFHSLFGRKKNPQNEEIMYKTDAQYAYLKLKIFKKIIYKEKGMKI